MLPTCAAEAGRTSRLQARPRAPCCKRGSIPPAAPDSKAMLQRTTLTTGARVAAPAGGRQGSSSAARTLSSLTTFASAFTLITTESSAVLTLLLERHERHEGVEGCSTALAMPPRSRSRPAIASAPRANRGSSAVSQAPSLACRLMQSVPRAAALPPRTSCCFAPIIKLTTYALCKTRGASSALTHKREGWPSSERRSLPARRA